MHPKKYGKSFGNLELVLNISQRTTFQEMIALGIKATTIWTSAEKEKKENNSIFE